eukprot:CAMPEP_0117042052 /NCGR_PEP_ID=MMETSP0472-20121206/29314_1 /TAXON_ID=693140 ORGANISM="Tiarina fusus, Strain LIS" /NCGR_SAMPLE_ID=MMETSP0472 /ASSEMBLY_ACC=CAM_ASM_000603 /LENGTH=204 /DNA_ID=CAMNT_0004753199 /DNA_START=133 /DNA_END=747 /DNA_ORIENTATION=-
MSHDGDPTGYHDDRERLRSSDPYNRYHYDEHRSDDYSRLRRTDPPSYRERDRDSHERYQHSHAPTNPRYPPTNYSSHVPRETTNLRNSHDNYPHPHKIRPDIPDKYIQRQQQQQQQQPTPQPPPPPPPREEEEPQHIRSYKTCLNEKLQIRGQYLTAFVSSSQVVHDNDRLLEEIKALERKQVLERSHRKILDETLKELDTSPT